MENKRRAAYESLVQHLEEPIREVVPSLWPLPFLIDTGYTCSGHVLSQSNSWHLHRAMLELAFSVDERTRESRDSFRRDLAAVSVEEGGLTLCFNRVYAFDQEHRPYSQIPEDNLLEEYNADIP